MTSTEPFVVMRDASAPGPWQVLACGKRTAGSVMFGEARLPPRTSGPGLHVHTREDEAVFVIAGVITFVVGDRRFEGGAGELVWLPREVPHTFANLGDEPAWAFGTTTPAGLEGNVRGTRGVLRKPAGATRPGADRRDRCPVRRDGPGASLGDLTVMEQ